MTNEYDIQVEEVIETARQALFPQEALYLLNLSRSGTIKRIETKKRISDPIRGQNWSISRQVARFSMGSVDLVRGIAVDCVQDFHEAALATFSLEDRLTFKKNEPMQMRTAIKIDTVTNLLIDKAVSALKSDFSLAKALITGMVYGTETSGNNGALDLLAEISERADMHISEVTKFVSKEDMKKADAFLRMGADNEGVTLSTGHPKLEASTTGSVLSKLAIASLDATI